MSLSLISVLIYAAVALVVATFLLLLRDIFSRGPSEEEEHAKEFELESLLPPKEPVEKDESWLGQVASQSGYGFTADTAILLSIMVGLAVGGALFVWRDNLLAAAVGGIIGILLVILTLVYLRARRHNAIREQLPDCMELMARAVRAGESLDQAIALVGGSQLRPVAGEFQYCASQMKMGLSLESAIRRMVDRAPLPETRILAMTLTVQRRRGGNLSSTLERLAKVFRDRLSFYRQYRAATALGRASVVMIGIISLALDLFVVLGDSEFMQSLLTTNVGRLMLAAALLLQLIGLVWVVWLFRPRY